MAMYNRELAETAQQDLLDQGGFLSEAPPISLSEYGWSGGDIVGYISIPAMDVELPLYLGASAEHMSSGAVVLGGTSLPIGGSDTNCVIAGHRGWRGVPFFREIERLQVGDVVTVTNIWETLTYQVTDWQIITPDRVDQVLIQPGKDMITLVTCHPYRVGTHRYLIYCERVTEQPDEPQSGDNTSDAEVPSLPVSPLTEPSAAPVARSSQEEIQTEAAAQVAGLVIVLAVGVGLAVFAVVNREK